MILCRSLGPVEVSVDGSPAPAELLWRKHLALLIYLLRSPKRTRTREHLIGLLWADKPESAARHSLNEALRVLRRSAGEEAVGTSGGQVRLASELARIDLQDFETLATAENWAAAAELIAGEFMEGFAVPGTTLFEEWLAAERHLWRGRSVEVLTHWCEALLQLGDAPRAVDAALRAHRLDPLSNAAARSAIRSLALAGDRAGALQLSEEFVARLASELGLDPDTETRALAERVRRERAWHLPTATVMPPAVEPRRAPLLGREEELARLLEIWARCREDRRAAVVVVEGDLGTGKTRLTEELLARTRLDGAAVASVRAVEADAAEPWSGVLALGRGGILETPGIAGASAGALDAFASQLPEWADRFRSALGPTPLPLGRALSEVLRAATGEVPMVLAVEDAQWLDRESFLALIALTRNLAEAPLLILFTACPHPARPELDEIRSRLGRDLRGTTLRLRPLSMSALLGLARWALPSYSAVELDRVVRRVATDSAGLPLLAVELLAAVAMGLDLQAGAGAWPEASRTLDQTMPGDLPDAVVGAIRLSFRRLSPNAQWVLAAASVLAERVDAKRLGRAGDLGQPEVERALDELEWQRWLTADPRGYTFVARIVRQVIARDMLTPGQRARIADRMATVPS
ncbi:MAG: AAA family ATPase [Gemmatimonadales bacterium]